MERRALGAEGRLSSLALVVALSGVLGLYAYGERAVGLWVELTVEVEGRETGDASVFTFTTWSTVGDFWKGSGYVLFVVSGAAAGVPYASVMARASLGRFERCFP